jgi:hypothetical protein
MKKKPSQESPAMQPLAGKKKPVPRRTAKKPREAASVKAPRHPLNPDRLAKIQIEAVSSIAATIGNDCPHESVKRAYELLDIAASAQAFLERSDKQSFEAGIDYHKSITAKKREFAKNLPSISYEIDSEGNRQNVTLEALIDSLYPDGREVKKCERETRLKQFIGDLEGIHDLTKKAERFAQLTQEGFPPNLVETIRVCFTDWWEKRVSLDRAKAGKAGSTKGQQRRVKSKSDARRGSRRTGQGNYSDPQKGEPHLHLLKEVVQPTKRY